MQYHLNGFKPGNLQISEPVRGQTKPDPIIDLPNALDVLIVGQTTRRIYRHQNLRQFGKGKRINTGFVTGYAL